MIKELKNGFTIYHDDKTILSHTTENPCFFVGKKAIDFHMEKGEFFIQDNTNYQPATFEKILNQEIVFKEFSIRIDQLNEQLTLYFSNLTTPLKIRVSALKEEKIYGLGEHFTSLNLRGHHVKNWVEEHITRKQIYNKIIRRLVKLPPKKWKFEDYKTYFVTPSFISSDSYFCHVETKGYGLFDFSQDSHHEMSFVSHVSHITFSFHKTLLETATALISYKGIFPPLPDWVYDGMILGVQGGTTTVNTITMDLIEKGAKINGIWSQDWCGELFTYFGKQVVWNWEVDHALYPNLKKQIQVWKEKGIKFLAYINPYLNATMPMFQSAKEHGYLVKNNDGSIFLTQATSFEFGIVDLTNEKAYNWFKSIIKNNYLALGIMGWMADFGEYLPTTCVLHQGNGEDLHNTWPDLWIQLNKEVLEETKNISNVLFFNRAGYSDNAKYTTLVWNGDQHVDFTDDFGMRSVVRAMLSLSLSGIGISHSDIGGYTTVPGIKRSKEVFLRWLEMNTFSPVLRSHEGNRPWSNVQPYSNEETKQATVVFSTIHAMLKPYLQSVEGEYQQKGYPMIRPLFFYYDIHSDSSYLLGEDIYVVPVMKKRRKKQRVVIPSDGWVHLFTEKTYTKGEYLVDAPLGTPPVFYKKDSTYQHLFEKITTYIKTNKAK